jgi:hypothetical protein
MPARSVGSAVFQTDAGASPQVVVNEATQTVEWTQQRPVQIQRFDLNIAAVLPANSRLVCEVRHTQPDSPESKVRRLDDATLTTGALESGWITLHRAFSLELPEGAGEEALQEAHRQINRSWRFQAHPVQLERPERLFKVSLPDGSSFEAVFILQPSDPSP